MHTLGNHGVHLQWAFKPLVEERRHRVCYTKGGFASNQGVKSMATHWLKSFWPVLLSGPQLAGETECNGSPTLDWVTPLINVYSLLCLKEWVILPCKGIQPGYVILNSTTFSSLILKNESYKPSKNDFIGGGSFLILSYMGFPDQYSIFSWLFCINVACLVFKSRIWSTHHHLS